MKKTISILLVLILMLSLACCGKNENKADTSLKDGETKITGVVSSMSGNLLTLSSEDKKEISDKFTFSFSDDIVVVEDGYYVVDYTADTFYGKEITVICNSLIQETYPAGLTDVRMIIIKDSTFGR